VVVMLPTVLFSYFTALIPVYDSGGPERGFWGIPESHDSAPPAARAPLRREQIYRGEPGGDPDGGGAHPFIIFSHATPDPLRLMALPYLLLGL